VPAFTIIKNGQLRRVVVKADKNIDDVIYTAYQQVLDEIVEGETWLTGAYSKDFYKLVEGQPVELTDTELSAPRIKPNKPGADTLVDILAADLKTAGIATVSTLPPNAEWTKSDAKNAIDQAAGRARFRMASVGVFVDEEYTQTELAVQQWRLDGSPANGVPDEVACWAEAQTPPWTNEAAAQDIEYNALGFKYMIALIRRHRLIGKCAVDAAQIDFAGVAQPFINYLNGI
jgi:hypothetical protein